MRHSSVALVLVLAMVLSACDGGSPTTPATLAAQVTVDGKTVWVRVTEGAPVRDALTAAGVVLNALDRVSPSENSFVVQGLGIRVVRVVENFEIEETVLPFERQTLVNHSMPEGQTQLQAGQNGVQEDTYRIVFEDGVEVSRSLVKSQVVREPLPEIVMVGGQPSYAPVPIEGTLAYISSGNAWIMRGSSTERLLVTNTSDLDGRAFSLSPDGRWLLYTTAVSGDPKTFNRLWALDTTAASPTPANLNTPNVLYAEWSPTQDLTFAYATGQPSEAPPGYVADNNLVVVTLTSAGRIRTRTPVRESSCGGQSAWWGTNYSWSPDGLAVAFAQANLVGVITLKSKECESLLQFNALNTYSRSAWVPWVAWAPGGLVLHTVHHEGSGDSQAFDLVAVFPEGGPRLKLAPLAGMFANPLPSPEFDSPGDERPYRIAFLRAVDPDNSLLGRYELVVMDRDGSNPLTLHPDVDPPGTRRQTIAWASDGESVAFIFDGNLWVVDVATGNAQQLTGDNATMEPRWAK